MREAGGVDPDPAPLLSGWDIPRRSTPEDQKGVLEGFPGSLGLRWENQQ